MLDRDEAGQKVFGHPGVPLRVLWEDLDDLLTTAGLTRDVKTIYVSYTSGGLEVVAAVHPGSGFIELALALPIGYDHPRVVDAVHLKWRTLPVAVHLRPEEGVPSFLPYLVDQALSSASSIAPRPIDDFLPGRS